ncbi:MAG: restriction endonuclease subunit S, partial [Methanosarcina sp.]|nr:restriction endonuclease subunit S [Methanosarcina sp.]
EGYKITELGMMPEDWDAVEIGQLVDTVKNGFASGKRDENGIVQIRMNNVTTEGTIIFDKYLKVPIPKNIETFSLKKGDFLFNNTNSIDLVGKSAIFCEAPFDCTFSNHFTRIRFKQNLVLPEIILLNTLILWRTGFFKTVAIRHVGQAAVHSKYLLKRKIPLQPLPQQQKIASILSKVDEQIEQTEQIIEKTEILKKGLMQKLLTKGIGHTKFKKTNIGSVPEQWEIKEIADVTDYVSYGFTNPMPTTTEGPFIITATNVDKGKIQYDNARHTSYEAYDKLTPKSKPIVDDVLLTKDGTLGKVGIVDRSDICINQSVACMRLKKEFVHLDFFSQLLQSPDVQKRILFDSGGSTIKHIYITKFAKMLISLPPLAEQQKIASILSKVDSQIQDNQSYLHKIQELKKGLMQDLLTGKVRVCV